MTELPVGWLTVIGGGRKDADPAPVGRMVDAAGGLCGGVIGGASVPGAAEFLHRFVCRLAQLSAPKWPRGTRPLGKVAHVQAAPAAAMHIHGR